MNNLSLSIRNTLSVIMITFMLCIGGNVKANELDTIEDVASSTTTFAVCKTLDVLSTAYVISHGIGVEAKPPRGWRWIKGTNQLVLKRK
jgi:hypothetical protein